MPEVNRVGVGKVKRLKRKIPWALVLGLLAASLLTARPGWTADTDSFPLSAPPPVSLVAATPAQEAAILGAEMLLVEFNMFPWIYLPLILG